ncbi:MAG: secondary thiamine-phosphate synthase enzyme YjbQ [Nitrososphaerota archaeon]
MVTYFSEERISTKGENDIIDITKLASDIVKKSNIKNGLINIFIPGSTGAVTTIEYEPGLCEHDLPEALNRIAPKNAEYMHHLRWGDDNGHSHVRASIIGPSLTIPIRNGKLILGTWQQIVFLELDTRPRDRKILFTIIGE